MSRYRFVSTGIVTVVFLVLLLASCARPRQEILYFYEAVCGSCEDSQRMEEMAGAVLSTGSGSRGIESKTVNVLEVGGFEALREALEEHDLDPVATALPLLIVEENVYTGMESVSKQIDELASQARQ